MTRFTLEHNQGYINNPEFHFAVEEHDPRKHGLNPENQDLTFTGLDSIDFMHLTRNPNISLSNHFGTPMFNQLEFKTPSIKTEFDLYNIDIYSDQQMTKKRPRKIQKSKSCEGLSRAADEKRIKKQKSPFAIDEQGKVLSRPDISYTDLIIQALSESDSKMLSLGEIYNHVINLHPYYRSSTSAWKNSIRHNLSVQKMFVRSDRPNAKKGKGGYWTLTPEYIQKLNQKEIITRVRIDNPEFMSTKSLTEGQIRHSPMILPKSQSMTSFPNDIKHSNSTSPKGKIKNYEETCREDPSFDTEDSRGYFSAIGEEFSNLRQELPSEKDNQIFGSNFEQFLVRSMYETSILGPQKSNDNSLDYCQFAFKEHVNPNSAFMPTIGGIDFQDNPLNSQMI